MPGKSPSRVLLTAVMLLAAAIAAPQAIEERKALFSSLDVASLVGKPVTNSKWEQVARVDSVLLDPATGKVTFFVLSFVDGNERVALPWNALSLDARGRARLVSRKGIPEGALRLGGIPSASSYSSSLDPSALEGEPPRVVSFKAEGAGEAILQGKVTGTLSVPGNAGRRHVELMISAGGESVRVDLGREEDLKEIVSALRPGEDVQIQAKRRGSRDYVASIVRFAGATYRMRETGELP
jgi:PRC-barrel domain